MVIIDEVKSSEDVLDDFMVNGVRFLEVERGEDVYYLAVDDAGEVSPTSLTDPREFDDAKYTFARVESTGEKVMVDDTGIHHEW